LRCAWLTIFFFSLVAVSCGRSVLGKSVRPHRILQNSHLVKLDAADLKEITFFIESIQKKKGFIRYVYPAFGVDFGFPDKS
jgi:glycerol 2-dehydrogenase (NADP+)